MEEIVEFNPQPNHNDVDGMTFLLQQSIQKTAKDMNFVGIFTIIQGVFMCLTIFGAIIGIPYVIMGMRLNQASKAFENYIAISDASTLREAMEKQGAYFFIQKVLIIIGIVFFVLYLLFIMVFVASLKQRSPF